MLPSNYACYKFMTDNFPFVKLSPFLPVGCTIRSWWSSHSLQWPKEIWKEWKGMQNNMKERTFSNHLFKFIVILKVSLRSFTKSVRQIAYNIVNKLEVRHSKVFFRCFCMMYRCRPCYLAGGFLRRDKLMSSSFSLVTDAVASLKILLNSLSTRNSSTCDITMLTDSFIPGSKLKQHYFKCSTNLCI